MVESIFLMMNLTQLKMSSYLSVIIIRNGPVFNTGNITGTEERTKIE